MPDAAGDWTLDEWVTDALRLLRVVPLEDDVPAAYLAHGRAAALALFAQLEGPEGFRLRVSPDHLKPAAQSPLSRLLAGRLAPFYGVAFDPAETQAALVELRRIYFPDDRYRDMCGDLTKPLEDCAHLWGGDHRCGRCGCMRPDPCAPRRGDYGCA